ncbi:response regulator [Streptomyces sp. NPDC052496]|uniref:response regulator n=1 Tax=Streptomyces sp. NPDC052496 TaxID=3154951 RepID=UPI0034305518
MPNGTRALQPGAPSPGDRPSAAPHPPSGGGPGIPAPAARPTAGAEAAAPPGTQAIKILLVDDRTENLLALEAVLAPLHHRLVRATSGEAALKALLSEEFALILLDVQMPGMDGFETAVHIKRRARTRHVPIIFLTAAGHSAHHTFRGYAVGAVDYLVKPFDPWVLRAKVTVFVALYDINRRLHEQTALLKAEHQHRAGRPATTPAVSPLLVEIDSRLRDAEDAAQDLYAQLPAHALPAGALATAAALAEHLSRLRQYTDLLLDHTAPPPPRDQRPPVPGDS